jgi:hypothetical protein
MAMIFNNTSINRIFYGTTGSIPIRKVFFNGQEVFDSSLAEPSFVYYGFSNGLNQAYRFTGSLVASDIGTNGSLDNITAIHSDFNGSVFLFDSASRRVHRFSRNLADLFETSPSVNSSSLYWLQVDNNFVYATNARRVVRWFKGSFGSSTVTPDLSVNVLHFLVDNSFLYVSKANTNFLQKFNKGGLMTLVENSTNIGSNIFVFALSPDNAFIYAIAGNGGLYRFSTSNFTAAPTLLASSLLDIPNSNYSLAVDSTHIYWGRTGTSRIRRININGTSPTSLTLPFDFRALKLSQGNIYVGLLSSRISIVSKSTFTITQTTQVSGSTSFSIGGFDLDFSPY